PETARQRLLWFVSDRTRNGSERDPRHPRIAPLSSHPSLRISRRAAGVISVRWWGGEVAFTVRDRTTTSPPHHLTTSGTVMPVVSRETLGPIKHHCLIPLLSARMRLARKESRSRP